MRKIRNKWNDKNWTVCTLLFLIIALAIPASATIYIDPLFHYHAPLDGFDYPFHTERYQNDGISRYFEYNGIITGSSMTENFKTSEANEIFNANFIKVPFAGAYYKEINDNLQRAYDAGKNIKYVIRCLDNTLLVQEKDAYSKNIDYPTYLYNDNPFDDVNYFLNKEIFAWTYAVISYTKRGEKMPSFDEYQNWNDMYTFGAESVLKSYTLEGTRAETERRLSAEEASIVRENIRQNVTDLAYAHPETTFYLFFSPYSICYWDEQDQKGGVDFRIDAEEQAIEELLKCSNIKVYSFSNNFEMICNLDNYKDQGHYGEWVNSWILGWMYQGKYLLTEENYKDYIETIRVFYNAYDYDALHE